MAAPITKIQVFGHSFVRRLREFIRNSDLVNFTLNLTGPPLIQYSGYSGARIRDLRRHLEVVSDFDPDIVVLVIGTNDIYDAEVSPTGVAHQITDLVDTFLFVLGVPKVIVLQTLHRIQPSVFTKYPVDIDWYNSRVDELNLLLSGMLNNASHRRAYLWRMKGFWSPECKQANFSQDGCHLSSSGQVRLISNIRAAVVAALRKSICC